MEALEVCPVCHEAVEVFSIGNCDHPICYRCSTRMRSLCNHLYCPICRTDLNQVYMIHSLKKYADIPRHGFIQNKRFKIFFEDSAVHKKYEKLLEHRCKKCNQVERTLKALQAHMRHRHTLFFCDLCVDHLKIFTSERKAYNRTELAQHRRLGDKDDSSYKGHPLCQFCDERYMDNDELYRHLRKDHFYCHFCEAEGSQDFYSEYVDLKDHFQAKHFLCEEGECRNVQFTNAFRSRIDYQAHKANNHGKNMSKSEAKQARTIDVNIQLAPRSKYRDRGVVSRDDYEDASQRKQKSYHRERTHKERFREADIEQAIQASLTVMKEENTKKPEEKRKSPVPDATISHDSENFPTLGNIAAASLKPLRPNSPADSDHRDSDNEVSVKTLAKHLSMKSSQSVQHGAMESEDFPSLSTNTASAKNVASSTPLGVASSLPVAVASVKKPKTDMVKSVIRNDVSYVSKSKGLVQEDFPGLPSANQSKRLSSQVGGPWGGKKPAPTQGQGRSSPAPTVVINSRPSSSDSEKPKSAKPKMQRVLRNLHDDNDFPSLGGKPANSESVGWLKEVKDNNNKKVKESKPIDWFEMDGSEDFRPENLKGDKDNASLIENFNNKNNKKKKKKKTKNNDSNSLGGDSGIPCFEDSSLDSIANSLIADTTKVLPKSSELNLKTGSDQESLDADKIVDAKQSKSESLINLIENVQDNAKVSKVKEPQINAQPSPAQARKDKDYASDRVKPAVQNTTEMISSQKLEEKCVAKENEFINVKTKAGKKILSSEEEFPSLTSAKQEEFPALTSTKQQGAKAPPPGFAQSVAKTTPRQPPGFGDSVVSKPGSRPPPGFQPGPPEMQSVTNTNNIMSTALEGLSLKSVLQVETNPKNYEYSQPKDFQSRNQTLIADIRGCFSNDQSKFEKFKSWSMDFRCGNMKALEYYTKCGELLGSDSFELIFPELLVLLPDIAKQQELLTAHNKSDLTLLQASKVLHIGGKSKNSPWSRKSTAFQSCPMCCQVLLAIDYNSHIAVHNDSDDFPTLDSQPKLVHTGPAMRGWVKAK